MPIKPTTYDHWLTSPTLKSPITSDALKMFSYAPAALVDDWNRDVDIIMINGKTVGTILLEEGKTQFKDIDELKNFFKKHLLSHLDTSAKEEALRYFLQVGHQGGLTHPVSGALAVAVNRDLAEQRIGTNSLTLERHTSFVPTKNGFTVQEIASANTLLSRDDPETPILPDRGKSFVLEANSILDIDFTKIAEKKPQGKDQPPLQIPTIAVITNTMQYGNKDIRLLFDDDPKVIFEAELQKFNNNQSDNHGWVKVLIKKAADHYDKLITNPELDSTKIISLLKLANAINELSDPSLKTAAQNHLDGIMSMEIILEKNNNRQSDRIKLDANIDSKMDLFIQLNRLQKAIEESPDSLLKNNCSILWSASCKEIKKLMTNPDPKKEMLITQHLAYAASAINGTLDNRKIATFQHSFADMTTKTNIGYQFLGSLMTIIGLAMQNIPGVKEAGYKLYEAGKNTLKTGHYISPGEPYLGHHTDKLFKQEAEKNMQKEKPHSPATPSSPKKQP